MKRTYIIIIILEKFVMSKRIFSLEHGSSEDGQQSKSLRTQTSIVRNVALLPWYASRIQQIEFQMGLNPTNSIALRMEGERILRAYPELWGHVRNPHWFNSHG